MATRTAVRAPSFRRAAEDYKDAVGGDISHASVRRVAVGVGQALGERREVEADNATAPAQLGESPRTRRVAEVQPIHGQGNISSDGTMILIRGEGWKEAKIATCSEVEVRPPKGTQPGERPHRRDFDPQVKLTRHSYVAGVWDADEFAKYQYAEGLRRGLDQAETLTSVNDGSAWIWRVTQTSFPSAIQIIDWAHASGHLHQVAKAVWGENGEQGGRWVQAQVDELWAGRIEKVVRALEQLDLQEGTWPNDLGDPVGYFQGNVARMRYADFRADGFPIGSGTVESGANNVVQLRMRRPGRGWEKPYANAMLALLCEYHSDRFEHTWSHLYQSAA